jgi:hypothetical protein
VKDLLFIGGAVGRLLLVRLLALLNPTSLKVGNP